MGPRAETSPRRRTQAERSAESGRRLLEATIELIAEKGFERTTAMEIGERAGYSRSMVRVRYGSKEALLEALLREQFEPLMLPPAVSGQTGLERALAMLSHTCVAAEAEPSMLRAFFKLCFETVGPVGQLRPWLTEWLGHYEAEMAAALRKGKRDGSVGAQVEIKAEARRVIAFGLGIAFKWVLDPGRDFVAEMREWVERVAAEWSPAAG